MKQAGSAWDEVLVRPDSSIGLFRSALLPMTFVACVLVGAVVLGVGPLVLPLDAKDLLILAGIVFASQLVVLLPLEWYAVRSRLQRPLTKLQRELLGEIPWTGADDPVFAGLRRVLSRVRDQALLDRKERDREQGEVQGLLSKLDERRRGDAALASLSNELGGAAGVAAFADIALRAVRDMWPADAAVVLLEEEQTAELVVVGEYGRVEGEALEYRRTSLPVPLKEALRGGAYAEVGLPFSHDQSFPWARSLVTLGLHHRGSSRGILYALAFDPEAPRPELLLRAWPLLSLGFSRVMCGTELAEAQVRDSLTGAYTQNHFLSLLRSEIARSNRYARPVSCVHFDLDDLRRLNDAYGEHFGDKVIAEAGRLMAQTTRSSDILGHIRGGEFVLLLPESDLETAVLVADRIRIAVESHPFIVQRHSIERLTLSAGVASHAQEREPGGLPLLDLAGEALQKAKRAGKNRVVKAS